MAKRSNHWYTIVLACLLLPISGWAQFELPGTDIWLLDISSLPSIRLSPATQRAGYDNQPAFSDDGRWLYYSRGELAADGLGYTDIWRLDLTSGASRPVTRTKLSEFSPLPIPNSPGISMVRVQSDGRQELWSVFPDSERPERRIVRAEPVGYHAWLSADSLALFVLGDAEQDQPNRLELWQPSSDSGTVLSQDIGRGLQVSQRGELFYIQNPAQIMRLQLNLEPIPVIGLYENGQDFALGKDDSLWHAAGSKLYRRMPADQHWQLLLDLQQYGLSGITRIAINPTADQLAVVAVESVQ